MSSIAKTSRSSSASLQIFYLIPPISNLAPFIYTVINYFFKKQMKRNKYYS